MKKITAAPISASASPWPNHAPTVVTQNVLTALAATLYNVSVSTAKTAPITEANTPPTTPPPTTETKLPAKFLDENPRLLVADDSPLSRRYSTRLGIEIGFEPQNIVVCNNRSEAIQAIQAAIEENKPFGTIFSDRDMGNDTDGDLLAEEVSRLEPPPHFIMISGTLPEQLPLGVHFGIPKGASLRKQLSAHLGSLP